MLAVAILWALASTPVQFVAQDLAPIVYRVRVPQPDTQYAEIEAAVPIGGHSTIELMMPVWSPGYYRVENTPHVSRTSRLTHPTAHR